ncbi:hypothetical protein WICMUC_003282 [Wickerhamomyces mucosus]|uniref:Uncharacterized protein n=1 Tax=Wickerhamomyces mucosus TaxID=1378264 RepID=A0A9P8PMZ1_9ASCO|nr:hypothetical protein WICMUC_003282 [Wickerhamomyces mucosus]
MPCQSLLDQCVELLLEKEDDDNDDRDNEDDEKDDLVMFGVKKFETLCDEAIDCDMKDVFEITDEFPFELYSLVTVNVFE